MITNKNENYSKSSYDTLEQLIDKIIEDIPPVVVRNKKIFERRLAEIAAELQNIEKKPKRKSGLSEIGIKCRKRINYNIKDDTNSINNCDELEQLIDKIIEEIPPVVTRNEKIFERRLAEVGAELKNEKNLMRSKEIASRLESIDNVESDTNDNVELEQLIDKIIEDIPPVVERNEKIFERRLNEIAAELQSNREKPKRKMDDSQDASRPKKKKKTGSHPPSSGKGQPLNVNPSWAKDLGLNLNWNKRDILDQAVKDGSSFIYHQDPQVHKCKESQLRKKQLAKEGKLVEFRQEVIKEFQYFRHTRNFRKVMRLNGDLYYLLKIRGGSISEKEADMVVDVNISCQENPGGHPLQTVQTYFSYKNYKKGGYSCYCLDILFSNPELKDALSRRGFELNYGKFSANETTTLITNINAFLENENIATDRLTVWELLNSEFFLSKKLFTRIGQNLNRSSRQMMYRLRSHYHPFDIGSYNAAQDQYIIQEGRRLRLANYHFHYKKIGLDLNRFNQSIYTRESNLKRRHFVLLFDFQKLIATIALTQNCQPESIDTNSVDFSTVAKKLHVGSKKLRKFWQREGQRRFENSLLPRWLKKDSIKLLTLIEECGESDENCINWIKICNNHFKESARDWKHLREQFNRLRRKVDHYMLHDLESVTAAAKAALLKGNIADDEDV